MAPTADTTASPCFAVDPAKGTLTPVEHVPTQGKVPRNFGIDPTGSILIAANQNSDNMVVFRIDANTGKTEPNGAVAPAEPACLREVCPGPIACGVRH